MTLRIVKASDPVRVDRINLCIYSPPGVGKTSLGFTAESPLLLDADEGAYRAANRGDSVPVQSWAAVADIQRSDLDPYKTVVVDTAGRTLDKLTSFIIEANPKMGRGGALTLQGYGDLKSKFTAWMKMLNGFGKDVVLLCHMEEQRKGDDVLDRLDVQGGSKGEIYKCADAMGKLFIQNNKRMIDFSPRENSYGKNPAQFDLIQVPSPLPADFLASLIRQIKDKLNFMSQEQTDMQGLISEWEIALHDLKTAEEFNGMISEAKKAGTAVSLLLHKEATRNGLKFDRSVGEYVHA